ncbi:MAG: extracellular solute-binding protein, partial [Hungatella sp.]
DGHKNIAIFCGDQRFSDNRSFLSGLKEILEQNDQECPVFAADHMMGMNVAFDILSSPNHFDAIITDCMEHADFFRIASEYDPPQHPPQLYSLASKEMIPGKQVVQYAFNYKLCGKTIADYIVKSENGEIIPTDFLKLPNDGFYHFGAQQTTASEKINILMLSCPTSKALKSLLPAFTKSTGIQVKLMEVSYDELYTSAADSKESQAYDLIRLDMAWLSELGKKLFLPLNMEEEPFKTIQNGFSANLPFDYYDVENTVYSLPFDPSVQILYYRKDLFEDALVKREFYERQLTVPKTFEEYNEVAGFFTQKYNPNSPTKYGTTLVFGSSIVAACDYLPRLKELGGVSISESGHVDLHTPAVKKALENYLQTYDYTDRMTQVWWQQAAELFAEGNVAMNILFANHASIMIQNHDSKVLGKIGFAAVPGGHPLLGGGIIGISKNTRKQEACKKFLHWIYSEQVAS